MTRFLVVTARKDLRRRLADPVALLIWVGIPFAIGGLMTLVGGGDAAPPTAKVWLVDEDETFLSGLLGGGSSAPTRFGDFLDIERVDYEEGRSRIDDGEGSALLVVPEGFQDAVLDQRPAELRLITNPAQRILPLIVQEGLEILVEAVFYLQHLFGEPLRLMAQGPPGDLDFFSDATIAALSVDINHRVEQIGGVLFPPVLTLETDGEAGRQAGGGIDLGALFLPGIVFMSLLFIAQGMSSDIWRERDMGTLRRAVQAPRPVAAFLGGKLLAATVFMAVVALVGLALGVAFFGASPRRVPGALLWSALAGAALFCLFSFVQLLASTRRAAEIVSTMLLFPLLMIGGSFFPFEAMPDWMARIGRFTPNGLAVVRLRELLFARPDALALLLSATGIALPAAAAFWLAVRRIGGSFASE